jgi:hypothetical protein
VLGQSIEMLVAERFRDRHIAHRAHYMGDPKARAMGAGLQLSAQRADGSEFPADIMLSPMEIDQRNWCWPWWPRGTRTKKITPSHPQVLQLP